jgi:hypothetical protein
LWRPIGLLLSTPLTVCLTVLGKHMPQLEFLAVLLGDEPALEPKISFYQRLLAGDEDEANDIVEQNLQRLSPAEIFDEVLVPALIRTAADRSREHISEVEQNFVLQEIREIVQRLGEIQANMGKVRCVEGDNEPVNKPCARIWGIPARSEGSEIALDMLYYLLDPFTCNVERLSTAALASEVVTTVEETQPDLEAVDKFPRPTD